MKRISIFLSCIAMILMVSSCKDEKLIYNPNNVAPGQLASINGSYVLLEANAANVAQVFNWGAFDMGYTAVVKYTLEMDLAGKNFANAQVLASSNSILNSSITVGQLNSAMIKLQQVYSFADATEQNVEFRVSGTISDKIDPFFTNVVSAKVTPYTAAVEFPYIYVIGDFNGWNHQKDQFLWDYTGSKVYEGWINFGGKAANGFKITDAPDWNHGNWGAASDAGQTAEGASMTLINGNDSKNITCYSKNFYLFTYNTNSLVLKVVNSMNMLGIIGDGANGWGDTDDIPFDFDTQTQQFVAIVTLKDGTVKFRGDHAWSGLNLGLSADATNFVSTGTLITGNSSKNIPVVAGTYKITLNLNNPDKMTYKFEATAALDPNKITPPTLIHSDLSMYENKSDTISWTALDFGGQTPTTVTYTVEVALKGTNFDNAQTLGTTSGTTLTISGDAYLTALQALDNSIGLDKATDVDMRVKTTVQGLSNTFYSNVATFSLTVQTPPQFPDALYMIGDEFGSWDWGSSGIVNMVPVNGVAGSFWCVKYFHSGKGFKWNSTKAWGGDFPNLTTSNGFTVSGGNAVVDADGLYMVYIDMSASVITIEPALIYGMGDCFGGWNTGTYPFTINSDGTASIVTTAAGDVRMYAGSSALSGTSTPPAGDWWRMEFVILDGKIAYRGNGGDQTRVSVNAGQTVTLDFSNDTGTIK